MALPNELSQNDPLKANSVLFNHGGIAIALGNMGGHTVGLTASTQSAGVAAGHAFGPAAAQSHGR